MKTLDHLCDGAVADSSGVRAARHLRCGEVVGAFGGPVVDRAEFDVLDPDVRHRSVQIADDLFQVADGPGAGSVSHSCDPNCGMQGSNLLVALRDIAPDEPLTLDHAMTDGDDGAWTCTCGAAHCRRTVTGRDWALPELQVAYRGFFAPYLAERIASLTSVGASRRSFAV